MNPIEELQKRLLQRMSNPETLDKIADALICAVTGQSKNAGDIIKSYDKILEILDMVWKAPSDVQLELYPTDKLQDMLRALD